ncbi:MAG TPA: FtsX-like permease family protein, partial [Steroidobacteraceae bacterium]|nr:FtsX-like permease family protein [Steroidobacteraceae bacterium]
GYFLLGAGNPAAYGIDRYRDVIELIEHDPVVGPMINVITPTQSLVGIAGNFSGSVEASKTFLGTGLIPSNRERMRQWDEFRASAGYVPDRRMSDQDASRGEIGVGLARVLGLCEPLGLRGCPALPAARPPSGAAAGAASRDLTDLAARDLAAGAQGPDPTPQIDLLAATAGGAPNVVQLAVGGAEPQGVKELDDNFVAMPLGLAQQLVYGRGEHKATGIVLQLHRSEDLPAARARLTTLFKQKKLDLEVRDFGELSPFYGQVKNMFSAIFLFIALVMGVIVLFAVVNTMTMNVMERTNEVGTIRALGVRRAGVRSQFTVEGVLIGAIGATVGAVLALVIAALINHAGLTWIPPGNATAVPLRLDVAGRAALVGGAWLGLAIVTTLAALLPANRAARLPVVDALRHV